MYFLLLSDKDDTRGIELDLVTFKQTLQAKVFMFLAELSPRNENMCIYLFLSITLGGVALALVCMHGDMNEM